jgi:hypothetical protein
MHDGFWRQCIKDPEVHERLTHFVFEQMFEQGHDNIVTTTQAYNVFCRLSQQHCLISAQTLAAW